MESNTAPDDFTPALAAALSARGCAVPDLAGAVCEARQAAREVQAERFVRDVQDRRANTREQPGRARHQELTEQLAVSGIAPTLEEFAELEAWDPNAFWRLACGDHQNLLDEALGKIEELTETLLLVRPAPAAAEGSGA